MESLVPLRKKRIGRGIVEKNDGDIVLEAEDLLSDLSGDPGPKAVRKSVIKAWLGRDVARLKVDNHRKLAN